MIINGENVALTAPQTLAELLAARGCRAEQVAVERNGAIVKQADFAAVELTDADKLEIVSFVGGG